MCKKDVTILYLKGIIDSKTYNEFLEHLLIKKKNIKELSKLEKYDKIRIQYTKLFKENRELLRKYRYVSLWEINANNKIITCYDDGERDSNIMDNHSLDKYAKIVEKYDFDM